MTTMEQVRIEALALSASERACLAHELLLSLESSDSLVFSSEYEEEIQRRVNAVREGRVDGHDADEVFGELRGKLAACKSSS